MSTTTRLLALLGLLLVLAPTPSHATIAWTCSKPIEVLLPGGGPYMGMTRCVSDTGAYVTGGDCLGTGCTATSDSAARTLCGSDARSILAAFSSPAAASGGTLALSTVYDPTTFKLQLFTSNGAAPASLAEKSQAAITGSSVVTLVAFCQ